MSDFAHWGLSGAAEDKQRVEELIEGVMRLAYGPAQEDGIPKTDKAFHDWYRRKAWELADRYIQP